jgi:DNA polymerase III subunit beta
MQFAVSKSALTQALALVGQVVEKKSTIPILSNVKLQADADSLTITGTDLEVTLSVRVEAKVAESGVATLPAKKLSDYSRLLAEGDVKFKIGEGGWATITAGRSKTRIAGMLPESFPEMPEAPDAVMSVPVASLLKLINRAKMAICNVESRFTLNGAQFEYREGRLYLIATDGHRLAFASADLAGEGTLKFLLPLSAIKNLPQVASGVESLSISQDDNHLFFRAGGALLVSRKMAGNFPDYQRVLPRESKIEVTLNRLELAGALSRVAQFADERSRAVRLSLKEGALEMFATTAEAGESTEAVPCDYAGEGIEMGFNSQYLSEFLGAIESEAVTIHLNDAKAAGEFRPAGAADYRYVVMPMRI